MNANFDIELLPEDFDDDSVDAIRELGLDAEIVFAGGGVREFFDIA